jgi:1,4-alpha-glucan branching enzyme
LSLGYLSLLLHAHLPFVRHPEDEHFLEEKWLYEALTETYIPLIKLFFDLIKDNIDFRLTLTLTPPLIAMLTDSLLQQRYLLHLEKMQELAVKEVERTKYQPEFHNVALMYQNLLKEVYFIFHQVYHDNLLTAFKELQDLGKLEIITCAATHGYLPLIGLQREIVHAQIKVAVNTYSEYFGRPPTGIWLPECAFQPGDDVILQEYGLKYFIVDTHGILFAVPRPRYGIYAPIYCPSGVAVFGRDVESSKQVWSAQEGYPGDYDYREFYRDIGYDLDFDYIKDYIHVSGIRTHTGFKYHRITGKSENKQAYVPHWAYEKAAIHAGNFMFNRENQIKFLAGHMDRPPIVLAPYDAELFGHWWFEGPLWLNFLIRKIAFDQETFSLITPGEYLQRFPHNQVATPCMSSWGYQGYNEVWLEGSNDWIYRHLHHAGSRMIELANRYPEATGHLEKALNQAAREILLAQSSDWAFIMKTGTMVNYAIRRTKEHIGRFNKLYEDISKQQLDLPWLANIESKDNFYPQLDYRVFQSR